MRFDYYIPPRIVFGRGAINKLRELKMPGKKALIVISRGISMKKFGYLERVQQILDERNISWVLFDKVLPNPTKDGVMEGARIAKEEGCDFIIGLGGGSSIDSAKSIAIMAANEGDYWEYIGGGSGKGKVVKNKPLPVIAITTTAGTGTEADPWTVITKEDTNEKIGFGTEDTFPIISIVDPELMTSVPAQLTAYQGFDALFHATEGYIASCANVMSDLYALKAIELIGKYLPRAVADGNDLEAREQVALANTLAGMVESTSSCTSEHSLEHALSAYHPDLPHGAGLIMVSLAYYKFFANKVPERFVKMAKALGVEEPTEAQEFISALEQLQKDCGVAELKMSDYGVDIKQLEMYAENAMQTMGNLFKVDPYPLTIQQVVEIYRKSYRE